MFRSARDTITHVPKVTKYTRPEAAEVYGCDCCSEGGWTSETEVEVHKTKKHFKSFVMYNMRKQKDFCCICIKKFADQNAVVAHIKKEHLLSTENCTRVEREIFICDHCSGLFFNKQNLVVHMCYSHSNIFHVKRIRCPLCFKKLRIPNVPAHFYMHSVQSVSTCRICLTKCKNTKELAEHIKTHPYYLKCTMCYFETQKVESFQNHLLLNHNNLRTDTDINVEDIEKYFMPKQPSYLRLQRVAGIRGLRLANDIHICVLCREICIGSDGMKAHISEHNIKEEKALNYVCSCGQMFTSKVLLKHHTFKTKHANS